MRSRLTGFRGGASALCVELAAHSSEQVFCFVFLNPPLNPVFAHDESRGQRAPTNISGAARVQTLNTSFNVDSGALMREFDTNP